jgi:hypothetical protein
MAWVKGEGGDLAIGGLICRLQFSVSRRYTDSETQHAGV